MDQALSFIEDLGSLYKALGSVLLLLLKLAGLVAPRNSLELTEESSLSTNYKEKDSLNISVSQH